MAVPDHPARNEYPASAFTVDPSEKLADKQRAPLEEMPTSTFDSSNVHSALYDYGERELYVRYLRAQQADAIYRYDDFPASEWQGLLNAPSKGSYINANVAYDYRYTRINRGAMPGERAIQDQRVRRFVHTP